MSNCREAKGRWKSGKTAGQLGHRTLKANYSATFNWITSVFVCVWACVCMCVCMCVWRGHHARGVWPMPKVVKSISLHFYEAPTVWHMASKSTLGKKE